LSQLSSKHTRTCFNQPDFNPFFSVSEKAEWFHQLVLELQLAFYYGSTAVAKPLENHWKTAKTQESIGLALAWHWLGWVIPG
jgi:hypothetical protein